MDVYAQWNVPVKCFKIRHQNFRSHSSYLWFSYGIDYGIFFPRTFGYISETKPVKIFWRKKYLLTGNGNKIFKKYIFRETVYKEDLLEAATALARALMYLEEQKIVHTNVRLANVFVSQHTVGSCFKVKLGDPGLPGK